MNGYTNVRKVIDLWLKLLSQRNGQTDEIVVKKLKEVYKFK